MDTVAYDTYDSPSVLLKDASLSDAQKCEALKRWAYDEYRLLESTYEGMEPDGERGRLEEVMDALRTIAPDEADLSDIVQHGATSDTLTP